MADTLGPNAGSAHITVKPSLRGWSQSVRDQLNREMRNMPPVDVPGPARGAAARQGRQYGEEFSGGFDRMVRTRIAKALNSLPPAEIGVSTSAADQRLKELRAELISLSDQRIGIDVNAEVALARLKQVGMELDELGRQSADIAVYADTMAASAQLAALEAQVRAMDGRSVKIDADTGGAARGLNLLSGAAATLLAKVGVLGIAATALLPIGAVLTGLTATLLASLTAVAGGVGVLLGALLGNIIPVVKAQGELEQKQEAAASTAASYASAQQGVRSALAGVAAAQTAAGRAVADAERAVADARRNAARSVQAASRSVVSAQDRERDALEALSRARDAAREKLAAYAAQLRGAALDESGAALAVTQAQEALNEVLSDPTATQLQIDLARQALSESQFGYDEAQTRRKELREQAEKDRKAGVKGDQGVKDAREQLADAQLAVADAERSLAQARADGARSVAAAERNLARARVDGAAQVAAAQDQLAQAQAAAADAAAKNAKAQAEVAERLAKLRGPAGVFVAALDRAKAAWGEFTRATAKSSFGLAAKALNLFSDALPFLVPLARRAARAVGTLLDDLGRFASSKEGRGFYRWLKQNVGPAIVTFGRSIGNILVGLGGFIGAITDMDDGFLKMTRRFADWGRGAGSNNAVTKFFNYIKDSGPVVSEAFGNIAAMVVTLVEAFGPIGSAVLVIIGELAGAIAKLDPDLIRIFAASMVISLVMAWRHLDGFRNAVKKAWSVISTVVSGAWSKVLRPVFRAMVWYLQNVMVPAVRFLWQRIIKPIFGFIGDHIARVWKRVVWPVLKAWWAYITRVLVPVVRFLWDKVVKPAFTSLGKKISATWNDVIKPVFQALRNWIRDDLVPAFRNGIDRIATIWERLKKAAGTPAKFVVDTVYNNGIRKVINAIPGGTDLKPVDTSGWGAFKTGGVLPGYTPGRDVHRFVSPTAGTLDLSGGEGILIPQATKQVGGAPGIAFLNKLARAGKLRNALAFAGGGVVPAPGDWNQHTSGYPWARWSGDINIPGSSDYGNPVRAWKPGVVASTAKLNDSYGWHVRINHPASNESTLYAHLSEILVAAGQKVNAGQQIGNVGSTGNSTGPHLHFEIAGGQGQVFSGSASATASSNPLARFMGAISASKDFAKSVPSWLTKLSGMGAWGKLLMGGVKGMGGSLREWINKKIPGPGPLPDVFDSGGIATGTGYLRKATIRPERVLSPEQTASFERLVATLENQDRAARVLSAIAPTSMTPTVEMRRFRIVDWDKGLAELEYMATAAAENVVASQRSHSDRISDLDRTYG